MIWRLVPRRHVGLYQKCQFSEEVVGFSTKKNKYGFEENDLEIQELLAKIYNYAQLV